MNNAALLAEIDRLIAESNPDVIDDLDTWHLQGRACIGLAYRDRDDSSAYELEFNKVTFGPDWVPFREGPFSASEIATARRDGVQRAVALLQGAKTMVRLQLPDETAGPAVDVALLHSWFAAPVAQLWVDGHHRQAVQEAARMVEIQLKAKINFDGDATSAVTEAFTTKEVKKGICRLRFPGYDEETQGWTNAHEGAMYFGRGCFMRIRNLYTHEYEPAENEALEALAAISLLARWIDEADVAHVEEDE